MGKIRQKRKEYSFLNVKNKEGEFYLKRGDSS